MAALLLLPAAATASPTDPTLWPDQPGTDPELTTTANTIRFAGANRFETNEALGLALRGAGDFPFGTSDPTGASAAKVAKQHWWGAASCPRSIIVVAGDVVADSLAAASLSDPTDRSEQPRLSRVAASDQVFDPPGGLDRVDTASAPIVITTSGRVGATALAPTARSTAADLARGGCTTAREAIIVGGTAAVPTGVEAELVDLGYEEVFRVAGADRYETAARVAMALGTGRPLTAGKSCDDADASDGTVASSYYGNAVIEYRDSASSCQLYGRTVVLTDGVAGIDALAAGWWTSYWQVPVLLTGPGGSLPPATRAALATLDIDTIVVLGGTDRIPEDPTVNEAKHLASAVAGTFAGKDRFGTAVLMAERFGGWYPAAGASFADDVFCLTASSGSSGSPDALAAGPFCARLAAAKVGAPERALPPAEGPAARTAGAGGVLGGHTLSPVLLTPSTGVLAPSVAQFLADAFAAPRCSGRATPATCAAPGFAAIVGGGTDAAAVAELDDLLGGSAAQEDAPVAEGFVTRLDLQPLFAVPSPSTAAHVCYGSDNLAAVRWLSLSTDATRRTFLGQRDVLRDGWYGGGTSTPHCMVLPGSAKVTVTGVAISGRVGRSTTFDLNPPAAFSLSRSVLQDGVATTTSATSSSWTFVETPSQEVDLRRGGISRPVAAATLGLDLTSRVGAPGVGVAIGRVAFTTAYGEIAGTIRADAVLVGGAWELAGVVDLGPDTEGRLRGGFRATVTSAGSDSVHIAWAVDGVPTT